MADTDLARHRARLYLRGERAFGLESVRRFDDSNAAELPQIDPEPVAAPAEAGPPVVAEVTRPRSTARPGPETVFGTNVEPPPKLAALPAYDTAVLSPDEKRRALVVMDEKEVRTCPKCRLCETRTQTVFGEGDPDAKIFFIGEGPGENEDHTGRPFVGKAGQLLDKMIAAMGLRREQVMIANIVKCRPPNNRVPAPDEVAACTPYLLRQLEIVRPHVIVTLGRPAAQYMLDTKLPMGQLRGRWQTWRGTKLMPTFHPSYVLRSYTADTRAAVWGDLQQVMTEVGLTPRTRDRSGA